MWHAKSPSGDLLSLIVLQTMSRTALEEAVNNKITKSPLKNGTTWQKKPMII
jgi:hypothetical protein